MGGTGKLGGRKTERERERIETESERSFLETGEKILHGEKRKKDSQKERQTNKKKNLKRDRQTTKD